MIDYQYGIIDSREVRLAAHPDPGRATKPELQCEWRGGSETGRPDFLLAQTSFEHWAPLAPHHAAPKPNLSCEASAFMYRTGSISDVGFRTGRAGIPAATKKKGGAINAPPLEGSDTSVSSPKRQTAEAVRYDNHAKLTLSQARLCVCVIVCGHGLARLDLQSR